MSTHNIEDGTGGMDASIRYELDREEVRQSGICKSGDELSNLLFQNIGQGMKDTFFHDFIMFKTKYVSCALKSTLEITHLLICILARC